VSSCRNDICTDIDRHRFVSHHLFCRTLIDSTPGVLKAWGLLAQEYSFDAEIAGKAAHGRRLRDTIQEFCHIDDETKLQVRRSSFLSGRVGRPDQ
jgi:hypothetical protein